MQLSCKSKILLLTTLALICLAVGYPGALAAPGDRLHLLAQDNGGFQRRRPGGGDGDGTFPDGALVRKRRSADNDGPAPGNQDNQNAGGNGPGGGGLPQAGALRRRYQQQQGQGGPDMSDRPPPPGFGGRRNNNGGGFGGGPGGGPGGGGPGRRFGGGGGGGLGNYSGPGFGRGQKLDFSSLNLSDDQKQRIKQLHEANGAKLRDLRKNVATRSQAFKDMMFDPSATDEQIRAKRKEVWRLRGQMEESQVEDFLGIRGMLNADQRQKLSDLKPGRQVAGNNLPAPGGPAVDGPAPGSAAGPAPGRQPGRQFGAGQGMRRRDLSNPNTLPAPDAQ